VWKISGSEREVTHVQPASNYNKAKEERKGREGEEPSPFIAR